MDPWSDPGEVVRILRECEELVQRLHEQGQVTDASVAAFLAVSRMVRRDVEQRRASPPHPCGD